MSPMRYRRMTLVSIRCAFGGGRQPCSPSAPLAQPLTRPPPREQHPRTRLAARPDMYTLETERGPQGQYSWPAVKDEENQLGPRAVGVPGVVAGLCLAHARF